MATQTQPDFDPDGYTLAPQAWTDDLARQAARSDGFDTLSEPQWEVLHTIHALYDRTGAWPCPHHLFHRLHTDRNHIETLFGEVREAYRLAGVPNPGEEAKTYL